MKTSANNFFGRLIARYRKASSMGVRELARAADLSHVQLINLEEGKRQPSVGSTVKIASALKLSQKAWSEMVSRQLFGAEGTTTNLSASDWFAALITSAGVATRATGANKVELDLGGGRKATAYIELS
jgi:transcriptional regulator with XRE-family HTH domain